MMGSAANHEQAPLEPGVPGQGEIREIPLLFPC
jgi:hypothetical protein